MELENVAMHWFHGWMDFYMDDDINNLPNTTLMSIGLHISSRPTRQGYVWPCQ
jgi:hypothetical protein